MKTIHVDMDELIFAMQNHDGLIDNYLDTETGTIIPLGDDLDILDDDEWGEKIEEDESGRFLYIKPFDSQDGYRIMEDFIESLTDTEVKQKLSNAIQMSKPFRRFKDQLLAYPEIRERWFTYEEKQLREYILGWLADNGIQIQ
jgi:hypothetical protein